MDETLTGTSTPDQSGPGSNADEGLLHTSQMQFNILLRTPHFLYVGVFRRYSLHILSSAEMVKTV